MNDITNYSLMEKNEQQASENNEMNPNNQTENKSQNQPRNNEVHKKKNEINKKDLSNEILYFSINQESKYDNI